MSEKLSEEEVRVLRALLSGIPSATTHGPITLGLAIESTWESLREKGLVRWVGGEKGWELVDADSTRRALAVEVLTEPEANRTVFKSGELKITVAIKGFELSPETDMSELPFDVVEALKAAGIKDEKP